MEKKIKKNKQVGVIQNINLNESIVHPFLQLINQDGENLGKVSRDFALEAANKINLDLVVVLDANSEGLPVAKIMNYSKKLYEDKKKNNTVKKKSSEIKIKEIRISLKIGKHDLECKLDQSSKLMIAGCRVKLVLIMKGRERSLRDTLGMEMMERATEILVFLVKNSTSKNVVFEQENDNISGISRLFYFKK